LYAFKPGRESIEYRPVSLCIDFRAALLNIISAQIKGIPSNTEFREILNPREDQLSRK